MAILIQDQFGLLQTKTNNHENCLDYEEKKYFLIQFILYKCCKNLHDIFKSFLNQRSQIQQQPKVTNLLRIIDNLQKKIITDCKQLQ